MFTFTNSPFLAMRVMAMAMRVAAARMPMGMPATMDVGMAMTMMRMDTTMAKKGCEGCENFKDKNERETHDAEEDHRE